MEVHTQESEHPRYACRNMTLAWLVSLDCHGIRHRTFEIAYLACLGRLGGLGGLGRVFSRGVAILPSPQIVTYARSDPSDKRLGRRKPRRVRRVDVHPEELSDAGGRGGEIPTRKLVEKALFCAFSSAKRSMSSTSAVRVWVPDVACHGPPWVVMVRLAPGCRDVVTQPSFGTDHR